MKFQVIPRNVVIVAIVVLLLTALGVGLYSAVYRQQSEHPAIEKIADIMQLPVAKVGNQKVTYTDYLTHLKAQRVFLKGPTAISQGVAREIGTEDRVQAYERAIRIAAMNYFAEKDDIVVTSLDVDRTFQDLVDRAGTSTNTGEILQFLQDEFGWDERQFKEFVVRPALIEDTLKQNRVLETQNMLVFDDELAELLNGEDTKRYISF